jgi:hypothetical protein
LKEIISFNFSKYGLHWTDIKYSIIQISLSVAVSSGLGDGKGTYQNEIHALKTLS